MSDPIAQLGLTCPSGGDFYVCQGNSTQFLGCCTSDPCRDGEGACPQADLRSSSFNTTAYGDIPSQDCDGGGSKSAWYTCSQLDTPFLGCCASNACGDDDGCPAKDLVAARLSDDAESAAVFETSSTAPTATASSTATTASSAASATGTTTSAGHDSSAGGAGGLSTGAKVSIAVGAAVVLAVLLVALFVVGRRYLKKRRGVVVTGSSPPSAMMSEPTNSYLYHGTFSTVLTPPPFFFFLFASHTTYPRSLASKASRRRQANSPRPKHVPLLHIPRRRLC